MRREEEIAKGKEQRAKTGVELHPAYYREILNSGVLSLSSGLSTTQQEAKYESEEDCIVLSLQLSTTMPEAKYHSAVDYPKVAHGVHAVSIAPKKSGQAVEFIQRIKENTKSEENIEYRISNIESGNCVLNKVSYSLFLISYFLFLRSMFFAVESLLLSGSLVHSALTKSISTVNFKNIPANGGTTGTDEFGFVGSVINN